MIYYNYLITTGDSSINRKANRKEKDEVILHPFLIPIFPYSISLNELL